MSLLSCLYRVVNKRNMMADRNIVHADPTTVATTHVEVLEVHTEDHQDR